jgi:hypothetical protein
MIAYTIAKRIGIEKPGEDSWVTILTWSYRLRRRNLTKPERGHQARICIGHDWGARLPAGQLRGCQEDVPVRRIQPWASKVLSYFFELDGVGGSTLIPSRGNGTSPIPTGSSAAAGTLPSTMVHDLFEYVASRMILEATMNAEMSL